MRLKNYLIIATICLCLCAIWAIATAGLSWQGELNPTEFGKWEIIRILKQDAQYTYVIAKNRDETSLIQLVILTIRKEDSKVMEYGYFKHGEVFLYKYHKHTDEYKRVEMQEWENKRCLGCHTQKIKPQPREA